MPQVQELATRAFNKNLILRNHPIFGGLGSEFLNQLSSYAIRQTVKRGTTIFTKGDSGSSLFAVCSGTVKISAPSPTGSDAAFNLIKEGGIFGEIALLDGRPRTADATAITDCDLLVIGRRDFLKLVQERAEVALKLIEVLCGRLRHTTEQLEDIMVNAFQDVVRYAETHNVNNRIAAYMLAIDRVAYTIRQRGIYA